MNSFHMFNEISNDFPGCAGTVTWQELELGADVDTNTTYTDVYLVCNGTGNVTPPQECQAPRGQTYTESCPNGQTGTITYTWVGEPTCSYKETNNCATIPDGKDEEICENEPVVKTKTVLCSEELGENYIGRITYSWDSETCAWKETLRTCEIALKRYLSHPRSCYKACRRTDGGIPAGYSTSIVNEVLRNSPGKVFARCGLDYQIRDAIGTSVSSSLPAGCSPGQECPSCELGKQYIVPTQVYCANIDTSTGDGWSQWGPEYSCYSITLVSCGEYTQPPTAGTLDCSVWRNSGSGGNVGIVPDDISKVTD